MGDAAEAGSPPPPTAAAPDRTDPSHPVRDATAPSRPAPGRPERHQPGRDQVGRLAQGAARLLLRGYWLWPGLLMLAVGLWRLGRPALWADELATWGAVRQSWGSLIHLLGGVDAVLAPYYLGEKAWTTVAGTSTVALRLPSVLAMAAAATLTAVLGATLAASPADRPHQPSGPPETWAGLLAGLAVTLIPATSRYAQEARPYAFEIAFAVLAALLLVRLMDRPGAGRAAGYTAAVALTGAAHLVGALLLAGHLVPVLVRRDRRLLGLWAASAAGALAVLSPLAWWGLHQREQISWIQPTRWRALVNAPQTLFGSGLVGGAFVVLAVLALVLPPAPTSPGPAGDSGAVRRPAVLLAAWAAAPAITLFLIAKVTPLFWPRYLLYTVPAYALLAALWLARAGTPAPAARGQPDEGQPDGRLVRPGRIPSVARWLARAGRMRSAAGWLARAGWLRPVAVLAAVALLATPGQTAVRTADGHSHATAQAAAIITANERPGDAIAYALHEPVVPWEARDIVARYVPPDRRPDDIFAVTPQRADGHLLATECPDPTSCLDRTHPDRIWLLRYGHHTDPLTGLGQPKENLLRSRYRTTRIWPVRGLTVALLTHR